MTWCSGDFHLLTYSGSFWQRYVPEWGATCAKFYIYPSTRTMTVAVTRGSSLKAECEAVIEAISFRGGRAPVGGQGPRSAMCWTVVVSRMTML
jgi:hypothetical protein